MIGRPVEVRSASIRSSSTTSASRRRCSRSAAWTAPTRCSASRWPQHRRGRLHRRRLRRGAAARRCCRSASSCRCAACCCPLGPKAEKFAFADEALIIRDEMGCAIFATAGTAEMLQAEASSRMSKTAADAAGAERARVESGRVDCVINIPRSLRRRGPARTATRIRRAAIDAGLPLITDLQLAQERDRDAPSNTGPAARTATEWQEYAAGARGADPSAPRPVPAMIVTTAREAGLELSRCKSCLKCPSRPIESSVCCSSSCSASSPAWWWRASQSYWMPALAVDYLAGGRCCRPHVLRAAQSRLDGLGLAAAHVTSPGHPGRAVLRLFTPVAS